MQAVRGAALRLRPSLLDDLGLLAAIRSLTKQVTGQEGVEVFVSAESLGERLDPEVETVAYRIVQEAVANACRHSGASAAYVRVAREPDALIVSVRDEGRGFDVGSARYRAEEAGHFGLSAMEERANALHGTCQVRSAPGLGTEVLARIPLSRPPVR